MAAIERYRHGVLRAKAMRTRLLKKPYTVQGDSSLLRRNQLCECDTARERSRKRWENPGDRANQARRKDDPPRGLSCHPQQRPIFLSDSEVVCRDQSVWRILDPVSLTGMGRRLPVIAAPIPRAKLLAETRPRRKAISSLVHPLF